MTLTINAAALSVITSVEPITGRTTVQVPGLGFFADEAEAAAAIVKVRNGVCPMTHLIERGFAVRSCPICGTVEAHG